MKYKVLNYCSFTLLVILQLFAIFSVIAMLTTGRVETNEIYIFILIILFGFVMLLKHMWFQHKIVSKIKEQVEIKTSLVFNWILWFLFALFTVLCFLIVYSALRSMLDLNGFTANFRKKNPPLYYTQLISIIYFTILGITNLILSVFDVFILIQIKSHNKSVNINNINSIGN